MRTCLLIVLCCLVGKLHGQDAATVSYSLFLIGDCGEYYVQGEPIGKVLRTQVAEAKNATVIYLGDNIYPKGLPPEGHRLREQSETILTTQAEWIRGLSAKGIFVPGNHDWHHWGRRGQEYIMNQQRWLDSLREENITLLPRDGCPGPVEIPLDEKNVLVIIDTQWFLHQWDKPGAESECDAKTPADALTQLEDIFYRNSDKRVIVAGHHPLITYGEHGGVFTLKSHLFPLQDLSKYLYVPMPVIGSIYPLYRKFIGSVQDTPHPEYKAMSIPIQDILKKYPGSIYVAGHEHALQHIVKDSTHFVVSGSGAKTEYVRKKKFARFASDIRGFARLDLLNDGSSVLHFIEVDEHVPEGKEVYAMKIEKSQAMTGSKSNKTENFSGKVIHVHASDQYHAGKRKMKWLGENYRKEWAQDIDVPLFDIGGEKGGLKILQRGGGMQTLSLRLADSAGHEYVLRSIEKFPENAVPEMLRKTFAQDLVQDQISAAHPYAALVIAPLAEAAGIYHTNPKLVYIPDDPRLGEYQKMFANTLALFEERPADDWSSAPYFGNSKKIVSTSKVIEKLAEDNDNLVDQKFVLKSRLFDMIIGDWDRHDDQWRWASFKEKKGNIYRPIPRDRDQAFFVNEGKLAKVWSRKWALPKFEGFDEDIDWPAGLSFNARYFDRSFLNMLTREEWLEVAKNLQSSLSNEEIADAIRQWPEDIFKLHGEEIIKNIKLRRDRLQEYALEHYLYLSKEVDIPGSDKPEVFEINHDTNGNVSIEIFKKNKEGEKGKKVSGRLFKSEETKELRLYGLNGDDEFKVTGDDKKKIRVRIIGGEGKDVVADSSKTSTTKTMFYDTRDGGVIASGKIADKRSNDPDVNQYNRTAFQYNRFAPLIYANYNFDDGLFLGGGFVSFSHGFRKQPFKQRHIFLASIAPLTTSFNFRYQGKFTEVIGKWNFEIDANIKAPNYVNNFFGLGNETVYNDDIDEELDIDFEDPIQYYRFRFEEITLEPSLTRQIGNSMQIRFGPMLQRIELEEPDVERFIRTYAESLSYNLFEKYNSYGGLSWQFSYDQRNDKLLTTRGATFQISGRNLAALNEESHSFSYYESSLALYQSFKLPARLVFALRVGGGLNTGQYEFYQAQVLDGKNELRGFRKTRFYGDSKFYSNIEARLKLFSIKTYLFPASLGVLGFYDVGRVWYKDSSGQDPSAAGGQSNVWHKGAGGGLWFTPFNAAVVSVESGFSNEGVMIYLRLGFLF